MILSKPSSSATFSDKFKLLSSKPSPPLVIVHGGAGSGKSRLINSLYTMMTDMLRQPGDDPNCPYVVLSSFTGAASANINGQTLHSLFGFKFGTTFLSMSEIQRAKKRLLFRNLRCVIVDEISMVSADLFYNLDLRLREITMVDAPFGGLSVFVFGDLYQLQPPKARYVFQPPINKEHALAHSLRDLWKLFTVVNLEENHRQGEDKIYGDLLNRVRTGAQTSEDIALLETRIRPKSDPSLNNAVHIYGTNAKVNARNNAKLEEIEGELFKINAKNASRTVKTFHTNNSGCIKNTPFQAELNLKINAEIVLVHNINTLDGLTNGCRGVLIDVEKKGKSITRLIVKLHNPEHGRLQREKNPCRKHPEATYIDPILWQYYVGAATATVFQFPVKGAAAITSHKIQVIPVNLFFFFTFILELNLLLYSSPHFYKSPFSQGQTVAKPNSLVVDVVSAHQPGMVYVMLSRCCSLEQLNILDKMDPDKILVNQDVKAEAKRMTKVSINNNPCNWMNPNAAGLKVCSLNVRSLRRHIDDVKTDPALAQSDILCLQEIWMHPGEEEGEQYQLEGFRGHFTCVGPGKGIAVYVKDKTGPYSYHHFSEPCLQLGKVSLKSLDIITIYRSQEEPLSEVARFLNEFIDFEKTTLIIGDFNVCPVRKPTNEVSQYLSRHKFYQLVTLPTHIDGGTFLFLDKSFKEKQPKKL